MQILTLIAVEAAGHKSGRAIGRPPLIQAHVPSGTVQEFNDLVCSRKYDITLEWTFRKSPTEFFFF